MRVVQSVITWFMNMSTVTRKLSWTKEIDRALERLKKRHKFSTYSGLVQHLIRRQDDLDREGAKLRKLIEEGIRSGVSPADPNEFFADLEKEISAAKKP